MAIRETAISYYGLNYVEHAEADFKEMIDHVAPRTAGHADMGLTEYEDFGNSDRP